MLYKVVIQKDIPGKGKPTEQDRARARRVVVVDGPPAIHLSQTCMDFLKTTLEQAGAFAGTTGEIVSITPAGPVITLAP